MGMRPRYDDKGKLIGAHNMIFDDMPDNYRVQNVLVARAIQDLSYTAIMKHLRKAKVAEEFEDNSFYSKEVLSHLAIDYLFSALYLQKGIVADRSEENVISLYVVPCAYLCKHSVELMLTNEQVIEELLNLAKQIQAAQKEGAQLGLTADELAFYDALTKPQAIKDFYENEELIAITKELAESLRNNRTIDWQKRDSARAKMRMMIKKLLKKHKYPPEGMDDAVQTVMLQCELWTDNNDMSGRVEAYASRLGQYASATHE